MKQKIKEQTKERKHSEHKTTMAHGMNLQSIFSNRINVFSGLTKYEVISEYNNIPLGKVLNYSEKQIEKSWGEIHVIIRYLRKKGVMAIVSKRMPRGTNLIDEKFGRRTLKSDTFIYYCCSTIDDALSYRAKLDANASGLLLAGSQIEEITENFLENRQIMKVINQ